MKRAEDETLFPAFMTAMPPVDVSQIPGAEAWRVTEESEVVFYHFREAFLMPEHTGPGEWGVVLAGALDLTVNGETRHYTRGQSYYVPAGVPHEVVHHAGVVGLEVLNRPSSS